MLSGPADLTTLVAPGGAAAAGSSGAIAGLSGFRLPRLFPRLGFGALAITGASAGVGLKAAIRPSSAPAPSSNNNETSLRGSIAHPHDQWLKAQRTPRPPVPADWGLESLTLLERGPPRARAGETSGLGPDAPPRI